MGGGAAVYLRPSVKLLLKFKGEGRVRVCQLQEGQVPLPPKMKSCSC